MLHQRARSHDEVLRIMRRDHDCALRIAQHDRPVGIRRERAEAAETAAPEFAREGEQAAVAEDANRTPQRLDVARTDFKFVSGRRVDQPSRFTKIASSVNTYPRTMNGSAPATTASGVAIRMNEPNHGM